MLTNKLYIPIPERPSANKETSSNGNRKLTLSTGLERQALDRVKSLKRSVGERVGDTKKVDESDCCTGTVYILILRITEFCSKGGDD